MCPIISRRRQRFHPHHPGPKIQIPRSDPRTPPRQTLRLSHAPKNAPSYLTWYFRADTLSGMNAVEFTIQLDGGHSLSPPRDVADKLPKSGTARIIVLTNDQSDPDWQSAAYQQFLRDDGPEDEVYQALR